jgi:large subunit ribosomal protein L15
MNRRQKSQKRGYLGHRSHGRGNVKNRRGSGNRGGRGMGGACKHKNSWIVKNAPGYFGKSGFVNTTRKEIDTVNLYEINQKALLNKLQKKEGKFQFEFNGKILATGDVTVPLAIRATCWSKNVEKKLSEAGGQISKIESKAA